MSYVQDVVNMISRHQLMLKEQALLKAIEDLGLTLEEVSGRIYNPKLKLD